MATPELNASELPAVRSIPWLDSECIKAAASGDAVASQRRHGCDDSSLTGKTILSLFDFTGNWSRPYAEAGANVVQLDIKLGVDILEIDCAWLTENVLEGYGTVDGILAAPPCTEFAVSGAKHWQKKDSEEILPGFQRKIDISEELVRQVLRCVEYLKPDWWALENPVGRINRLVPELGSPWFWEPWWYGDPWTKKTALYGNFCRDLPRHEVTPIKHKWGSWHMRLGGKSKRTKELRSATPEGFARAFFAANCWKGNMIKKNDRVKIKPEWKDKGDEDFVWVATDDEEKGRVTISPDLGLPIRPLQTVTVEMVEVIPAVAGAATSEAQCERGSRNTAAQESNEVFVRNYR